ncbi:hypothetical protein LEP1GSC058_2935 [Leptospira fainei serovar Hurstbridge str. BUT 6]|uniref:Uncharacterized protein n=1 Tax=Leptospira fainei serovar Hurstbridge str. BUT 6 TaxID=1193011 RepID=S3UUS8_9LEPT|nr:hypothetical protein [Leptospira fainei]EPG74176.1 hypothetical protein LEP1GSC058_2935 [Leptospira fainei serovar Hurstbridge str. BUT 6]
MKKSLLFILSFYLYGSYFGILAQDTSNPTLPVAAPRDKMVCKQIDLEITGTSYNDGLRCETKDAICYMIEGFAMSCFPKQKSISGQ